MNERISLVQVSYRCTLASLYFHVFLFTLMSSFMEANEIFMSDSHSMICTVILIKIYEESLVPDNYVAENGSGGNQ